MKNIGVSFILLAFLVNNYCFGQLRNVRFLNHVEYMVEVIQATIAELEHRGWCNIKLPETEQAVNETVLGREALGTVSYKNGFLVSIERLDIQQSTVQQVWNFTHVGLVDFRARMRLHEVVVGFDVVANLNVGNHHYTATYRHPMVYFDFSIVTDMNANTVTTRVLGVTPASTHIVNYMPKNNITDILTALYDRGSTIPGINAWGPEVLNPVLNDIVHNKVKFPTICYNCPG